MPETPLCESGSRKGFASRKIPSILRGTIDRMSDVSVLNLSPGQQVGGYTLVARLGGGAMGSVWRVQDDGGQEYAMKILRDSLSDQEGDSDADDPTSPQIRERVNARERLRREALALRKIDHPGVCNIVDMELDDALAFIVTELIEGKTLRDDVASNGRYVGDDLERLSRKLIDAVRAVHTAGIVHRDIKPTNVMIASRGPVLVDFGIAMGAGESHVTRTGLVMGTPGFIAPEIIDGEESDDDADWWSTAAVLGFAATGKAVFGTKPMMAVLERAASGNADLSGLPTGTLAAFRKALNPKRSERCSPDELLHAIALDAMIPELWLPQATAMSPGGKPLEGTSAQEDPQIAQSQPSSEVVRPFGNASSGTETVPALTGNTALLHLGADDGEDGTQMMRPDVDPSNPRSLWRDAADIGTGDDEAEVTRIFDPPTTAIDEVIPDQTALLRAVQVEDRPQAPETIVYPVPESAPQSLAPPQPYPVEPEPSQARSLGEVLSTYRAQGGVVIFGIAALLAVIAMSLPTVSAIIASMTLWALFTQGLVAESRLNRQSRRDGAYKRSDGALSLTALPWYLVKSLLLVLPRLLISLLLMVIIATCVAILWDLPDMTGSFAAFGIQIHIPLIGGVPFGISGITLGVALVAGWLVCAVGPASQTLRVGAGRLLNSYQGVFNADGEDQQSRESRNRRRLTLAIIWGAMMVAALVVAASKQSIDWAPVPLLEQ